LRHNGIRAIERGQTVVRLQPNLTDFFARLRRWLAGLRTADSDPHQPAQSR